MFDRVVMTRVVNQIGLGNAFAAPLLVRLLLTHGLRRGWYFGRNRCMRIHGFARRVVFGLNICADDYIRSLYQSTVFSSFLYRQLSSIILWRCRNAVGDFTT